MHTNQVLKLAMGISFFLGVYCFQANAQSLTIQTPDGTEERKFGETIDITWTNGDTGSSDYFQLFYSKDDENFVNFFNGYIYQLTNDGANSTRSWNIPDFGTDTESQVRIRVYNSTQDVADTSVAFRVYYEPSVKIVSPVATDERKFGEQLAVSWINGDIGSTDYYQLFYSKDGAAYTNFFNGYIYQLTNSEDTSTRNWNIPDFGQDHDSQVRIRVYNSTRDVADTSEAFRVYYEPSVKIVSPVATDERKFGEQLAVSWINGDIGSTDYYQLFYSKDGAAYTNFFNGYIYQLTNSEDTSTRNWNIPDFGQDDDSQVRVRVYNSTRDVADTSEAFRVYYEPSVKIVSPVATDERKFGEQMAVSWVNGDIGSTDYYQLFYSKDGAAYTNFFNGYIYQLTNSEDTSTRNWNIPDFGVDSASEVTVRVYNSTRDVADTSEAFRVYYEPAVKIKTPFPGEYLLQGSSKPISWENGDVGSTDYFQLYYSADGGSYSNFYSGYIYQLTNEGNVSIQNWNVPAIESNNVRIRVQNVTRAVADTTESFIICSTCPAVAIYTPNGGEVVGIGKEVDISWSVGSTWEATDNIVVDYSLDGGSSFETNTIFDGAYSEISDNTVTWTVDGTATTQGLIRVTNVTQSANDVSDNTFTIVAPPAIPADFSAQENANQTVTFTWTDQATNETAYRIEYSSDRSTWYNFSNNLSADVATYTTSVLGENAYWWRIKVSSPYFSEYSDTLYAGGYTPFGQSLAFDGSDDAVTLPDSSQFKFGTGDFTIETWFKTTTSSSSQVLVSNHSGASNFFVFYLVSDKLNAALSTGAADVTSTSSLELDTWYHAAMVRSGDNVSLYINGVEEGSSAGIATRDVDSSGPVLFGRQSGTNPYYFNGALDEVRIWNVARSAAEIADKMDTVLLGTESGLAGYYQMNHKTGNYLADKTANQLHGTWSGASGANASAKWVKSEVGVDKTPVVTVGTPNGGESLTKGEKYNITWTTENIPDSDLIEIKLSTDGGTDYTILNDGTFGDYTGSYNWTVDAEATTTGRIVIVNTTQNVSDTSNADFTILEKLLSITILSPNGGEFWEVGTQEVISWESTGVEDNDLLEIRLSLDGGQTHTVLTEGNASSFASGQFSLTVPDENTEQAVVSIVNTTQDVSDSSDEPFTIGAINRSITVVAPNGGEIWQGSSVQTISWTMENMATTDLIEIRLSTDAGETFSIINDGTFGSYEENSYNWQVTNTPTESALISVVNTTRDISDQSDAVFTITPGPDLVAPEFVNVEGESIIGETFQMNMALNEQSTIYLVILSNGQNQPEASQIKGAALGEVTLEGQAAMATLAYDSPQENINLAGDGSFVRQARYDFFLTAEDTAGNLNQGFARYSVLAQFTPFESDSIVIDLIYNTMGGEDWSNIAEGWTELPMADREEITISEERITGIALSGKSLTGRLPEAVTTMDGLQTLDLSQNQIMGIPNLSNMPALVNLNVSDNLLDFGDLEPNAGLLGSGDQYSPQANIGEPDSVTLPRGSAYTLAVNTAGTNNYQWYFDPFSTYEREFNTVPQANSHIYHVEALDFENMGTYYLEVTNELLPELTMLSEPLQLWATANLTIDVTGDDSEPLAEGAAYALRNRGPGLPYDSIPKEANGSGDPAGLPFADGLVLFENLLLGDYLIGIRSDPDQYLPTYYANTYLWEEADTLNFRDDLEASMSMFVIPEPLTPDDGDGSVAGEIESNFGAEEDESERILSRKKVKRAGCSMRRFVRRGRGLQQDGDWELIAYVESDDEGRFRFEYIPAGTYRFNIEYPGIPMDPDSYVEFEIGEDGSPNNSLELKAVITEDGIQVERINTLGFTKVQLDDLNIYPNPAADQLNIEFTDAHKRLYIRMIDLSGNVILERPIEAAGVWDVDTYQLTNGMYFVNILDPESPGKSITYKVIIQK